MVRKLQLNRLSIFTYFLRTPFHSDVFGSSSWSANIFGRKSWLILPPGQELKLKDSLGNFPFTITKELLEEKSIKYFEVLQECNETLFVPSSYFHQVLNLEDTVSVNHNWFNGCNINVITRNVLRHHEEVEREIADCQDMEDFAEHCQLMLKSSFGMNFEDLLEIIELVVKNRLKTDSDEVHFKMFDNFRLGKNHKLFDLNEIRKTLKYLKADKSISTFPKFVKIIDELLNKL